MTLQDCLRVFRQRWRIVLALALVGLVATGVAWHLRPRQYTAALTMYVSAQTADTAQSAYQGAQLSQQRVTSYVELVTSPRVTDQVVRTLQLPVSPSDLAEQIEASSVLDSVLVDVAVTDTSPERAAAIANAVGRTFSALVNDLERPTTPGTQPPVAVRIVNPAQVPPEPSSMTLPVALALGLFLGFGAGIAAAFARNAVDTSVTSADQLRDITDAPNLGFISFDPDTPKRPLTVHEEPQSPRSEAFRQLRTNLQFVDVDRPPRVMVVTSSLPAEGKSTTLANLAIAMASGGYRVLVIEGDLRRPKLADLLGLDRTVGLTSVLAGRVPAGQAVQHWPGGVDVLASGPVPPNPSELLASQQMEGLVGDLRNQYDVVLIDTPPLLPVTDAAAVARAAEGVILVCRHKHTKRDQLRAATEALHSVSAHIVGTVFTMVPANGSAGYATYSSYYGSGVATPAAPTSSRSADGSHAPAAHPAAYERLSRTAGRRSATCGVTGHEVPERGGLDLNVDEQRGGRDDLVTIVVPARNEQDSLPACLESLLVQDWPALEVLVVDGASTDRTAEVVRAFAARDGRVRLLHNERQTIPVSLNLALREAQGRWLVRVDAHASVPSDYVSRAVRHLQRGRYGGVGGRKDGVGRTAAGRAVAAAMSSRFGVGGSTYHWGTAVQTVEHVPFGAYPVDLVRSLGGWDENLRVNQDFELDFRLRAAGWDILFDPAMRISWECRQSVRDLYRQYRRYGAGKVTVARKHPTSVRARHLAAPGLVAYLGLLVGFSVVRRNAQVLLVGSLPYVLGTVAASLYTGRPLDAHARVYVAPAFVAMHLGWGRGFLTEAVRSLRSREPQVKGPR